MGGEKPQIDERESQITAAHDHRDQNETIIEKNKSYGNECQSIYSLDALMSYHIENTNTIVPEYVGRWIHGIATQKDRKTSR